MIHEELRYAHEEGHTDVCYSEDGCRFITCGADGDIRIWSTGDPEDPIHNCVGEWALSVNQKGDNLYVATSTNDIQILRLPEGDRNGVLDRFVAPINYIATEKNSQLIALAGEDMEVKLINLERANKEVQIFDGLTGPCLSVAITSKSKMVAAASGDTKLRVWNMESQTLLNEISCFPRVNSFANAKVLCRIDFEPSEGKDLAYPDRNQVIILNVTDWSQKAALICNDISAIYSIVQYSPCGKYIIATSLEGDFVIWKLSTQEVVNVSKHAKSKPICGLKWNPKGNGEIVYTDVEGHLGIITESVKEMIDEGHGEEDLEDMENAPDVDFTGINFEDDNDEDNENAVSIEKLKQQYNLGGSDDELQKLETESSHAPTPRPRTPEVPIQPSFMPSSTPEHLDPRYMCWNDVGIIRSYGHNSDESASKSIEVEFHDTTFHSSMMMQNYQEYTMGSVSKAALVVANSSQLNVIPLAASSKEWSLKVEENEEIILVAASENLVCFAMANYIIRVALIYGTQRGVISVPGPIVSMVSFKNILMIAYHTAGVRNGDQCINIRLVNFEKTSIDCKDIGSALGPESTMTWLGFSDAGTPAMMDSLGMLSLYPCNSNIWIPFCDTAKHRKCIGDAFFVTAVFETYQAVAGIKCKGTVYPGFTPRPTLCEVPLEPPFVETSTEKTQMEMNLFTWSTLQVADTDKKFKETAIKTFALACRNNLDERALEFIETLSNPQLITLSLKYASKLDKKRLVERLMDLATRIADETEDSRAKDLPVVEDTLVKPVYRKLSLNGSSKFTPRGRVDKKQMHNTPETSQPRNVEVSTPHLSSTVNDSLDSQEISTPNSNSINSNSLEDSISRSEVRANPFLKSLKKSKLKEPNPLSLTDKFAGVSYEKEHNEHKAKNGETGEKRKLSDSETDKQKEKQRKLDSFSFKKRT